MFYIRPPTARRGSVGLFREGSPQPGRTPSPRLSVSMTSVLKYRSGFNRLFSILFVTDHLHVFVGISPSVTSIYDYRLALHLESPSPTQPEHRLARCTPYLPPSPNVPLYELYNAQARSSRLNDNLTSLNTTSRPLAGPTQAPGQAGRPRSHPYQSSTPISSSPRSIPSVFPSSSRRTQPHPTCRVTIPTRATLQHVPSPIGSPVSPLNQSYRFRPFVEDDDDEATPRSDKRISVFPTRNPSTFSHGTTSSSPSGPRTKRTRPHPRLSIFLTPPLQATGSPGASSPPPTPILAVLEEGYHDCLRAVMKQDALVSHPTSRLCYVSQPASEIGRRREPYKAPSHRLV